MTDTLKVIYAYFSHLPSPDPWRIVTPAPPREGNTVHYARASVFVKSFSGLAACLVTILLASCQPGQVNSNGYHCGDASSGHCYAIAEFIDRGAISPTDATCTRDMSSNLFGFKTAIGVTSGQTSGDQFFNNEMWFQGDFSNGWIEAGYNSDRYLGFQYFWAQRDNDSGLYVNHWLTTVPQADISTYTTVSIFNAGPDRTTSNAFTITIQGTATNLTDSTTNTLWSNGLFGTVNLGMELAGSGGASANTVWFYQNKWMDAAGHWRTLTANSDTKIDQPPYGGWIQTPCDNARSSEPSGGAFMTECCLPPAFALEKRARPPSARLPNGLLSGQEPRGAPGITPTLAGATPAFSTAQLQRFAESRPLPRLSELIPKGNATTVDCKQTAKALGELLPHSLATFPDSMPVCYVEFKARFAVSAPPRKTDKARPTFQYTRAFEVFDAHTGNLLMNGAR